MNNLKIANNNNIKFTDEASFKNFEHLKVEVVPEKNAVWLYFNAHPRPCFSMPMFEELDEYKSILRRHEGRLPCNGELIDIEWNVITSDHSVFSFGGDLGYFLQCIENKDKAALKTYARHAIDAVYYNHIGHDFDITTISLIQGNALGGGFEAALSSNILVAERSAEMGFPEVLFNLFPGMGAYDLLSRKVSPAMAEKIMLSGRLYSSEELYEMGIVDYLVEDGEGEIAVNELIRSGKNRTNSNRALSKVRQRANQLDYQQLIDIGDIWVDAALNLSEKNKRTMSRLVRSQERFAIKEDNHAPMNKVAVS